MQTFQTPKCACLKLAKPGKKKQKNNNPLIMILRQTQAASTMGDQDFAGSPCQEWWATKEIPLHTFVDWLIGWDFYELSGLGLTCWNRIRPMGWHGDIFHGSTVGITWEVLMCCRTSKTSLGWVTHLDWCHKNMLRELGVFENWVYRYLIAAINREYDLFIIRVLWYTWIHHFQTNPTAYRFNHKVIRISQPLVEVPNKNLPNLETLLSEFSGFDVSPDRISSAWSKEMQETMACRLCSGKMLDSLNAINLPLVSDILGFVYCWVCHTSDEWCLDRSPLV